MKWICKVCGYIHEGDTPPDICPVCKVGKEAFELLEAGLSLKDTHVIGLARGVDARVIALLQQRLQNDCREVAQYLAMARAADREGYPEAASLFERLAMEEAQHAGRLQELLGECADKKALADLAKELKYDAVHDALHEMAKDEARHAQALNGLMNRLFPAK